MFANEQTSRRFSGVKVFRKFPVSKAILLSNRFRYRHLPLEDGFSSVWLRSYQIELRVSHRNASEKGGGNGHVVGKNSTAGIQPEAVSHSDEGDIERISHV